MNLFIIPSWYPSPNSLVTGVFFKEQAMIYSALFPMDNIGISHWGQNDERLLLWSKDRLKIFRKTYDRKKVRTEIQPLFDNCTEYFSPAFTWSRKFHRGNMRNIAKANLSNLRKFEKQYGKVDLIVAQVGFPAGVVAMEISEKKEVPFVITEHMTPFPFPAYRYRRNKLIPPLWQAYQKANGIIAVSENLRDEMSYYGINNVAVLPNFIGDKDFVPAPQSESSGILKLVSIGRLERQKGFDVLLKSLANLKDLHFRLEIIGDGSERDSLVDLAEELELSERINWRGSLDKTEIIKSLQLADLFVLASRHESFGIVFLEALACGVPCVGTYCGGPEEIVDESVGFIVAPENEKELAKAIRYILVNQEKYPKEKIRAYFDKQFGTEKIVKKLRKLYLKASS